MVECPVIRALSTCSSDFTFFFGYDFCHKFYCIHYSIWPSNIIRATACPIPIVVNFQLMGCALLGVGIWLHIEKDDYVEVSDTEYLSVTAACIAAGCVMIVISFCGCCGAMMENQWMLMAVRRVLFFFAL